MLRWTGDQCLQVFYDLNGAVMLADIISSDHIEEYPGAAEAAAAALQATVRRDPLIAFKARLNVKSSYQPSNSSGLSPTLSSPGTQTNVPQNLQLKVTSLLDLITCSRPEVQTRLITIIGLMLPSLGSKAITELLDCGFISMLFSLYTDPVLVELRTSAIRTTNILVSLTLKDTGAYGTLGSVIIKGLLSADICDVLARRISSHSLGDDSVGNKEGLLETLTLLELLASHVSAKAQVSPWVPKPAGSSESQLYPVTAADFLLASLAGCARNDDEYLNKCMTKIFDTAVHVALHCTSRTLLLMGTTFTSSCIEIACNSRSEHVVYHAVIFLSCVAYLPAFAEPLLLSNRHVNLCERVLNLALSSSTRNSEFGSALYLGSSADVLLYILYQTSVNSSLLSISSGTSDNTEQNREAFLMWDAYSLFLSIARNELLWSSLAKQLTVTGSDVLFVALKIIHVVASYKDLEVLETVWGQLQTFGITQLLINLAASNQVEYTTLSLPYHYLVIVV